VFGGGNREAAWGSPPFTLSIGMGQTLFLAAFRLSTIRELICLGWRRSKESSSLTLIFPLGIEL